MANVDLITKKIKGAKKGTLKYYHEEGHLKFEEECSWGNRIRVMQDLSIKTLIFAIGLGVLFSHIIINYLIVILMSISIFSEIIEEKWCWSYARTKLLEKKRDDEGIKTS